jgi:hypothetical protein
MQRLKRLSLIFATSMACSSAAAQRIPDTSPMGTIDMATCAAAAKGASQDYNAWAKALEGRYRWYYPEMTKIELKEYVDNVVFVRAKKLSNRGIIKKEFLQNYYDQHCAAYKPSPRAPKP